MGQANVNHGIVIYLFIYLFIFYRIIYNLILTILLILSWGILHVNCHKLIISSSRNVGV